jgi:hypothetical protein
MKENLIALCKKALTFLKRNGHVFLLVLAGTQLAEGNLLKFALFFCLWAFVDLFRNK